MSEHKPGFTYIYSKALQQEIAYSQKTGKVYCSDGVQYSPEELKEIQKTYGELPLQVHHLKKHFGGKIISAGEKNENNDNARRT